MANIITLTDATLQEAIDSADMPILVDFWAEWCGPCKMIAPILEQIAAEHPSALTIAKLNVDDNPSSAQRFDVMSIPTLILFQEGVPQKRIVGSHGKGKLLEELAPFIS